MTSGRQRDRIEKATINGLTTVTMVALALPILAVLGGVAVRLFRWIAGW